MMRSRIDEPLVGALTTCFKLCLVERIEVSRSLKSPRRIIPQLGYWLHSESIVEDRYSNVEIRKSKYNIMVTWCVYMIV